MTENSHPDFYVIDSKKNQSNSYIDKMMCLVKKIISNTSHQNSSKIIFLSNSNYTTISFINFLLKKVEDSNSNIFLFIKNHYSNDFSRFCINRCITYNLFCSYSNKKNLLWLIKKTNSSLTLCTIMLKLSNGSPLFALHMLKTPILQERDFFYRQFSISLKRKNFFFLFSFFKKENFKLVILWICSILMDAIKIKFLDESHLINLDKKLLIINISSKYSFKKLHLSISSWFKCKFNLINVVGINQNVLIMNELIKLEKLFFHM